MNAKADVNGGDDGDGCKADGPQGHGEAGLLVGGNDALPVRGKLGRLGFRVADGAGDGGPHREEGGLSGAPLDPILAAKAEIQAVETQFQHFRVAVGVTEEFLQPVEELGASVDLSGQSDDERLTGPTGMAAPRGVEGDVIDKCCDEPGGLVGAGHRDTHADGTVAGVDQVFLNPQAKGFRIGRGHGALQFGREFQKRGEGDDQRVLMRAGEAGFRTATAHVLRWCAVGLAVGLPAEALSSERLRRRRGAFSAEGRGLRRGGGRVRLHRPDSGASGVVGKAEGVVFVAHRFTA